MEYSAVLSNTVEILPHREFLICCLRACTLFVNIGVSSCEIVYMYKDPNDFIYIYMYICMCECVGNFREAYLIYIDWFMYIAIKF